MILATFSIKSMATTSQIS